MLCAQIEARAGASSSLDAEGNIFHRDPALVAAASGFHCNAAKGETRTHVRVQPAVVLCAEAGRS